MLLHGIEAERVHVRVEGEPAPGRYLLYWMDRSQRAHDNPALAWAVAEADRLGRPVVVLATLDTEAPEVSERALAFQLEGLRETARELAERGIAFLARAGDPAERVLELAADACLLVCDGAYLRRPRALRLRVAESAGVPVVEIEGDVAVPAEVASSRLEVAARTFRPRVQEHLGRFLGLPELRPPRVAAADMRLGEGLDLARPDLRARELARGRGPAPVSRHHPGGSRHAMERLERFADERLARYPEERRRIEGRSGSELSMYLRYGQISPLRVIERLRRSDVPPETAGAFVEQLVVRRELAVNYVVRQPDYDRYRGVPAWARATLAAHRADARERLVPDEALLEAATGDEAFDGAMLEMLETGAMHPTLRMYWGKRLLAWTADPEQGFERTLELNNRYFLDGGDANSFAGVAWCYGLHDRPFPERAVFGTVRSMTAAGLRRKYDPARYVAEVRRRVGAPVAPS